MVFAFTGQLDAYSEKQFTTFINDVLASNPLSVVIDLSNIDFIDSCGLGAMVQAAKKCNDAKRTFLVYPYLVYTQYTQIIQLSNL